MCGASSLSNTPTSTRFARNWPSGWDKPWVLYVAALFHDIAKGRGGDHSELGEVEALRFCKQHDVSRESTELIAFVVREHLTMSRVAQKTDLSDPDVIAAFAKRVGNERYLTALYLFTVADIRGTSPKVWNAWKGKLLEDLYRLTLRVLGGHAADPHVEVETRKREALIQLALHAQPFEAHKGLVGHRGCGLLHAPRRLRHCLAHTPALAPCQLRQVDRAGPSVAAG